MKTQNKFDSESTQASPPMVRSPRDRGMVYFVVKYGVLAWGVTGGIVYFLMEFARKADNLALHALYATVLFPLIGLAAGIMMWFFGGRKKK